MCHVGEHGFTTLPPWTNFTAAIPPVSPFILMPNPSTFIYHNVLRNHNSASCMPAALDTAIVPAPHHWSHGNMPVIEVDRREGKEKA